MVTQNPKIPSIHRPTAIPGRPTARLVNCGENQYLSLLRGREVDKKIGIGRSTRYAKLDPKNKAYDPDFPLPVRIGRCGVRWVESEIDAYIAKLPRARVSDWKAE